MIKILRFVKQYYRSILILLMILYLSTVSGEKVSTISWITIPYLDKIIHLLMYLTFSITVIYETLRINHKIPMQNTLITIILFAIIYGGAMELIQEYIIKSRSGDWVDFGFNVMGAGLSIPLLLIYKRIIDKKNLKRV